MGENLTRKILRDHLAKPSEMKPGDEIYLKVDQTITHDINAVMTYLAFEAIGLPRIGIESAVSYLDHNLLYITSRRRMTTSICSLPPKNLAYMSQGPATGFAILCSFRDLLSPASC